MNNLSIVERLSSYSVLPSTDKGEGNLENLSLCLFAGICNYNNSQVCHRNNNIEINNKVRELSGEWSNCLSPHFVSQTLSCRAAVNSDPAKTPQSAARP